MRDNLGTGMRQTRPGPLAGRVRLTGPWGQALATRHVICRDY
jgi:hypothetical protein